MRAKVQENFLLKKSYLLSQNEHWLAILYNEYIMFLH